MTDKIRTINLYEDGDGKTSAELTCKEPHRVIYLQWDESDIYDSSTWSQDRIDDDDVAYIRKDIFHDCELEIVNLRQDLALAATEAAQLRRQLEDKS